MAPKITKCRNNHYYDAERYDQCPYCSPSAQSSAVEPMDNPVSVPEADPGSIGSVTVPIQPPIDPSNRTVPAPVSGPTVSSGVPNVTVPVDSIGQNRTPAQSGNNGFADSQKTVAKFSTGNNGKEPVVGWLVCVEGKHRGEDFRLKVGNNFIGRDRTMDVVLGNDMTVSRNKHAILTFDPMGGIFIIRAGESHELTYFNGQLLLEPKVINAFDKIALGSTVLMFVPLCGENFKWENE